MKSNQLRTICGLTLATLLNTQPANAINIVFDYSLDSNGFFADSNRRTLLEQAGTYIGSRLGDSLQDITSSGINSFTAVVSNPGTGASAQIENYSVAADTLMVFAGGRSLGGSTLGVGGPGGFSASGTSAFLDKVQARGQMGALDSPATDFGPWGGAVSFDTGSNWYFDADPNTTEAFSGFDFFSVALHELGHLLGIGSAASWDAWISGGDFTGSDSVAVFGGTVGLDSDLAHWSEGTMSTVNGSLQEAAMDPSISSGTRKLFTDLEFAALSDIGWEVTPVPLPPAAFLFVSGLLGLLGWNRRLSRIECSE